MNELEAERRKCLARLQSQESAKLRPRLLFELATIETRLGYTEDALSSLRDAIACGLDAMYAKELATSATFKPLWHFTDFEPVLCALEGDPVAYNPRQLIYAKGELAQCVTDALMCVACTKPLREPLVHTCGFMFCTDCVAPPAPCPHCHINTDGCQFTKMTAHIIVGKLNALLVHCPRCMVKFNRVDLEAHLAKCPTLCAAGCRAKVLSGDVEEHARQCLAVQVVCSAADVQCPWRGARKDLHGHTRACKFVRQQGWLRRISALEDVNRSIAESHRMILARLQDVEARMKGTEGSGQENTGSVF